MASPLAPGRIATFRALTCLPVHHGSQPASPGDALAAVAKLNTRDPVTRGCPAAGAAAAAAAAGAAITLLPRLTSPAPSQLRTRALITRTVQGPNTNSRLSAHASRFCIDCIFVLTDGRPGPNSKAVVIGMPASSLTTQLVFSRSSRCRTLPKRHQLSC